MKRKYEIVLNTSEMHRGEVDYSVTINTTGMDAKEAIKAMYKAAVKQIDKFGVGTVRRVSMEINEPYHAIRSPMQLLSHSKITVKPDDDDKGAL